MWQRVQDWWLQRSVWEDQGIQIAINAGNTHIELTEEETVQFTNILSSVVDRWINSVADKNIDGNALVDKARKAIASHYRNK